jgi:hypothetical protein
MIVGGVPNSPDIAAAFADALAETNSYSRSHGKMRKDARAAAHLLTEIEYNIISIVKGDRLALAKPYLKRLFLEQRVSARFTFTVNYPRRIYEFFHFILLLKAYCDSIIHSLSPFVNTKLSPSAQPFRESY